jgi:tetratricopeptide (TPR) repeat protein
VPVDAHAPIEVETEVRYRKFDATYMKYVYGAARVNDLPVMVLARDAVTLPVRAKDGSVYGLISGVSSTIPQWQRWQDYGIGLLREGDRGTGRGALRQADEAFTRVETLQPAAGSLARARVAIKEGRLDDASMLLAKAASAAPASPWSVVYFTALVDKQNGNFTKALEGFRRVLATDFAGARERGFDFAIDTRVLNEFTETLLEASQLARADASSLELLREAKSASERSLKVDPEQAQAWWLMNRVCEALGDTEGAESARTNHAKYKPDENARDNAVRLARQQYPWADHAAEATVFYDMQRTGGFTGDLLPGTRLDVAKPSGAVAVPSIQ